VVEKNGRAQATSGVVAAPPAASIRRLGTLPGSGLQWPAPETGKE